MERFAFALELAKSLEVLQAPGHAQTEGRPPYDPSALNLDAGELSVDVLASLADADNEGGPESTNLSQALTHSEPVGGNDAPAVPLFADSDFEIKVDLDTLEGESESRQVEPESQEVDPDSLKGESESRQVEPESQEVDEDFDSDIPLEWKAEASTQIETLLGNTKLAKGLTQVAHEPRSEDFEEWLVDRQVSIFG